MEPSSAKPADEAAGVAADTSSVTREVEVPLFRYLASLVVSVETIIFAGGILAASIASSRSGELVTWLSVVVVLIVYVAYLAGRFFRVGSFVVDTVDHDIRVSLGLLATSVESIPPGRIHALQLSQPWPWRVLGWWRLEANLASTPGAQVSKAPSHTVLLPVATLPEVMRVVAKCIPTLAGDQARDVLVSGLQSTHAQWVSDNPDLKVSIGSPKRARYRIPLSYTVNGERCSRTWCFCDGEPGFGGCRSCLLLASRARASLWVRGTRLWGLDSLHCRASRAPCPPVYQPSIGLLSRAGGSTSSGALSRPSPSPSRHKLER